MAVVIENVVEGSIAADCGVMPGHKLLSIDGNAISDVLDYRFYLTEPHLTLLLEDAAGSQYTKIIRKDAYEDLGLEFPTYLMDEQKVCKNNCIFCFVSQMPPGQRDSLYLKDDDSRMSFLFGNYITLTNLEHGDIDRIIRMRMSPVNVSVHTTNPHLRVEIMKNPRAGEVLDYLLRLAKAGIQLNCQIVLCPGVNDGAELDRTLRELGELGENLQSVAVVPVGLTRFRQGLTPLRGVTCGGAREVLRLIDRFGDESIAKTARRVFYAADEFYLLAGQDIPRADHYEEFAQLENGVGLLALLIDEFNEALDQLAVAQAGKNAQPGARDGTGHCPADTVRTIATGQAAYPFIAGLARRAAARFPWLTVRVVPIRNDFFGHSIVVAGLITGADLLNQLSGMDLGDELLLPAVMLRRDRDMFLDSMSVEELKKALNCPIRLVENDGRELLEALTLCQNQL